MDDLSFTAVYGVFDQEMLPLKVIDATEIVTAIFFMENKITIPAKTDFNQYFEDPAPGKRKYLQIKAGNRKHNIIEDDYDKNIEIDLNQQHKNIKIVYYAYINRKSNWKAIVSGQLLQLKSYGLLDEADLYVHITDAANIFEDVIKVVHEICKDAVISLSNQNLFEFPAISLIYDLALKAPENIFIYLHTKGMSYNTQTRVIEDIALLTGTFENWRKKMEAFKDRMINKLGLFPAIEDLKVKSDYNAKGGWIRHNFWYARGSYIINNCLKPQITYDRWYFEVWLAGPWIEEINLYTDCHSLYDKTNENYFTVTEATDGLLELTERLNNN